MEQTKTRQQKGVKYMTREPNMYNVIMHNDDVTTMDFVVHILMTIFRKSQEDANTIMMSVHTQGSAVAGTYHKDIAESKVQKAIDEARQNGFPLNLTIEEDILPF